MKIALISETAHLIGDPARANMLLALKDDGEIASGDLAHVAGVSPSTASEHLAKLVAAGLVSVRIDGRRRYYRLSGYSVAEALESIEGIASTLSGGQTDAKPPSPGEMNARCCYDHIAGRVGVLVCDALFTLGYLGHSSNGVEVSKPGLDWLSDLGVDTVALRDTPRRQVRLCPDWSMGSVHLGGATAAALLTAFLAKGWMRRYRGRSVLEITPGGAAALRRQLDVDARPEYQS